MRRPPGLQGLSAREHGPQKSKTPTRVSARGTIWARGRDARFNPGGDRSFLRRMIDADRQRR